MTLPVILPRGMKEKEAAVYLGISPSKLRDLPIPRRVNGGNRLYDRLDLDAYFDSLPYEGEEGRETNSCDEAFGVAS